MFDAEEYNTEQYYNRFGYNCCPVCGASEIKTSEREKSGNKYMIYNCSKCKTVIKREFR